MISQALNAEGIMAYVAGAHTHSLFGTNNPLASVEVMVRRDHRLEALRVLRRVRAEAEGLEIPDDTPMKAIDDQGRCVVCRYDMQGLPHNPVCPECGTNLEDDDSLTRASLAQERTSGAGRILFFALALLVILILVVFGFELVR